MPPALEPRRVRLAETLSGCREIGEMIRSAHGDRPAGGIGQHEYGGSVRSLCGTAFFIADTLVIVAEDHLDAWATLMTSSNPHVFPQPVVTRAAVEASVRAWYLMDPALSEEARACRVLNERLEWSRLTMSAGDSESRAGAAIANSEVWKEARALELPILANRRGHPFAVGEPRPTLTELLRQMPIWPDDYVGGAIYRFQSGVAHSNMSAIFECFEFVPMDEPGLVHAKPRLTRPMIEFQAALGASSWVLAIGRVAQYAGWDTTALDSWRGFVGGVLLEGVPDVLDELERSSS